MLCPAMAPALPPFGQHVLEKQPPSSGATTVLVAQGCIPKPSGCQGWGRCPLAALEQLFTELRACPLPGTQNRVPTCFHPNHNILTVPSTSVCVGHLAPGFRSPYMAGSRAGPEIHRAVGVHRHSGGESGPFPVVTPMWVKKARLGCCEPRCQDGDREDWPALSALASSVPL